MEKYYELKPVQQRYANFPLHPLDIVFIWISTGFLLILSSGSGCLMYYMVFHFMPGDSID